MSVALITGSAGLIGSEATRFFSERGLDVLGIDNDMRSYFFGAAASTKRSRQRLEREVRGYRHVDADIRDQAAMEATFASLSSNVKVIIHTASQPSHDWAAGEPLTDFTINANGTLGLLELARRHCEEAPFIFPEYQQGLRRRAEPAAADRDRDPLGTRPPTIPLPNTALTSR